MRVCCGFWYLLALLSMIGRCFLLAACCSALALRQSTLDLHSVAAVIDQKSSYWENASKSVSSTSWAKSQLQNQPGQLATLMNEIEGEVSVFDMLLLLNSIVACLGVGKIEQGKNCRWDQIQTFSLIVGSNQCTTNRLAAQKAYAGVNRMVQSMAQMISNLCGCVFTGDEGKWWERWSVFALSSQCTARKPVRVWVSIRGLRKLIPNFERSVADRKSHH